MSLASALQSEAENMAQAVAFEASSAVAAIHGVVEGAVATADSSLVITYSPDLDTPVAVDPVAVADFSVTHSVSPADPYANGELPAAPTDYPADYTHILPADLQVLFSYSDVSYDSELQTALSALLQAPPLANPAANAIWTRETERHQTEHREAVQRLTDAYVNFGMSGLDAAIMGYSDLQKNYDDAVLTAGRAQTISDADIAYKLTDVYLSKATIFEASLMAFWNRENDRILEAAEVEPKIAVEIYLAQIEKLKAANAISKAIAEKAVAIAGLHKAQAEAAAAKATAYADILEGNAKFLSADIQAIKTAAQIAIANTDAVSAVRVKDAMVSAEQAVAVARTTGQGYAADMARRQTNYALHRSAHTQYANRREGQTGTNYDNVIRSYAKAK